MTITEPDRTTVATAEVGHLYLVSVSPNILPVSDTRSRSFLAAKRGTDDGYWFVILPVDDTSGWPLGSVSNRTVPAAIRAAFPGRCGWWVESGNIALIEEVPLAQPVADPRLSEEAARLREALVNSERELEAFKEKVTEVGLDYAERHGWCTTFDTMMREIGLPGRTREWSVEVTAKFTFHVVVEATTAEEAEALVNDESIRGYVSVPDIFEDLTMSESQVYGSDIEVDITSVDEND